MTNSSLDLSPSEQALYEELLAMEETRGESGEERRPRAELPVSPEELEAAARCIELLQTTAHRSRSGAADGSSGVPQVDRHVGEAVSPVFGKFHLLHELGQGGFGVVYRAFDTHLQRTVAVKIPRLGRHLSPEMRQRFLREARAAAALHHPHIVTVYESGEVDGVCFAAFAYCDGEPLSVALLEQPRLREPRVAAELVAELADALQHAHDRGVLHRDLKPANVLLERATLYPRLTDFGLARLTDGPSDETRSGAVLGTASYMAPEQASGRVKEITVASDVYGLGAILYEMLTGRAPFVAESYLATLRQVETGDLLPPKQLSPQLPSELETICLKCLEKQPAARYGSAGALREDLQRFLRAEPIHARAPSRRDRILRWIRRHPVLATVLVSCGILLVTIATLAAWHQWRLSRANSLLLAANSRATQAARDAREHWQRAVQGESLLQRHLFNSQMQLVQQFVESDRAFPAAELLEESGAALGRLGRESFPHRYWSAQLRRGLDPVLGGSSDPAQAAFDAQGDFLAMATPREIACWELPSRIPHQRFVLPATIVCVAVSPDASWIASGDDKGNLTLFSRHAGTVRTTLRGHHGRVNAICFAPSGRQLISGGSDGTIRFWDIAAGSCTRTLTSHFSVQCLAVSYDGKLLASGYSGGTIQFWDLPTGTAQKTWDGFGPALSHLAFDASARRLLMKSFSWEGSHARPLRVWDIQHEREIWSLPVPQSSPRPAAFFPDGKKLACLGDDSGQVEIWDIDANQRVHALSPLPYAVNVLAVTRDGSQLVVGCPNGWIGVWRPPATPLPELGHAAETWATAYAPTGKRLATGGDDALVKVWDATSRALLGELRGHTATVTAVVWTPASDVLVSASLDETIRFWDAGSQQPLSTHHDHKERVRTLAISPDGRTLASGDYAGRVFLWDLASRTVIKQLGDDNRRVRAVAFSPSGEILAAASESGKVTLWESLGGRLLGTLDHPAEVWSISIDPTSRQLAASTREGRIHLWDLRTLQRVRVLTGHTAEVRCVAFSNSGRLLASGGEDRTVRLWDPVTGQLQSTLHGHTSPVYSLSISPAEDAIATGAYDGAVRIWEAP